MPDELEAVPQPSVRDIAEAFSQLNRVFGLLLEKAAHDGQTRESLFDLAQTLLAMTDDPALHTPENQDGHVDAPPRYDNPEDTHAVAAADLASDEDVDRLISTRSLAEESRVGSRVDDLVSFEARHLPFDAERIATHVGLKVRACRWLEQHGFTTDPVAIAHRNALKDEASAAGCALWMFDPNVVNPFANDVGLLANNYKQLVDTLLLWERYRDDPSEKETAKSAAKLLAEVQAALRVTVAAVRSNDAERYWFDPDQNAVFQELREYARSERVFLESLQLEAPVAAEAVAERDERREALEARAERQREQEAWRQKQLKQIGYHAEKLAKGSHKPDHDWQKIMTVVEDLIADGVPESDLGLREVLRPLAALPSEQVPPEGGVARALFSLGQATQSQNPAPPLPTPEPSEDVLRLRRLLGGGTIVVLGGEPRPETVEQYKRSWRCDVNWLESQPHQSIYHFEPHIAKDDVRLVLLLIRWSSHVFAEVKRFCDDNETLFVRIPSGYSVNTVTHVVLEQVGERLEPTA